MRAARFGSTTFAGVLVVAMAVVVAFGILPVILGAAGFGIRGGPVFGKPMSIQATLDTPVDVPAAPRLADSPGGSVDARTGGAAAELTGPYGGNVTLLSPTTEQRVLYAVSRLAGPVVALVVIALFLLIVRTIEAGEAFTLGNARRLRWIAAAVSLGALGAQLLWQVVDNYLLASSAAANIVADDIQVSLLPVVAGLGVLGLAEVFRRGALMRADLEGLV
jgi:hypothetical protein